MKHKLLFIAALAIAAVSCNKQPGGGDDPQPTGPATFKATFASVTKVAFNGTELQWQAGDEISVFSGADTKNYKYATTDKGATATFTGEAPSAASYVAVYPYDAELKLESGAVKVQIPTDQVAVAGACAQDAIVVVAGSKTTDLEFKTAGALVSFNVVTGVPVRSATLAAVGMNDKLSGEAKVTVSESGLKVSATSAADDRVTLGGGLTSGQTYYIVAMPGNYVEGLTFNFQNEEGKVVTKEIGKIKFEAGKTVDLGTITIDDGEWYMSYELDGAEAIYEFIAAHEEGTPKEIVRNLTVKNTTIYPVRELKNRIYQVLGTFTMENIQTPTPGTGSVYMAMFEMEGGEHSICVKNCTDEINPAFFAELKSKVIEGDLIFQNCPNSALWYADGSDIGLVEEVKGNLIIEGCHAINGNSFKKLTKVGGDFILRNNKRCYFFKEKTIPLTEIGGSLEVKGNVDGAGNPSFGSVLGFDKLTKLGGNVTFFDQYVPNEDDPSDTSIKGLKIFKTYLDTGVISPNATILIGRDENNPIDVNEL